MNVLANQLGLFVQSISQEMFQQDTHGLLLSNVEGPHLVEDKGHVN